MEKIKFVLTDPYQRKTFDLFNIIKRNFSKESIIIYTKNKNSFLRRKELQLYYMNSILEFHEKRQEAYDFIQISHKYRNYILIYFPVEEKTTLDFLIQFENNKQKLSNFKFKLSDINSFNLVRNKSILNSWCKKNNILIPKKYSKDDIMCGNFKLPLIVKPSIGSGSRGIKYIKKIEHLSNIDFSKEIIIQQKISNSRNIEGCFLLADNGKVVSAYTHKRLRTYPKSGGVSVFSKLTLNQEITRISESIVSKLNLSGLIMIEYIFDEIDNTYKLIEINPRIWGSILLSEFSNNNFILNYINLAMKKKLSFVKKINSNSFLRWLFPYDLVRIFSKSPKNTCYINITYANRFSSILFHSINYTKKIFNF